MLRHVIKPKGQLHDHLADLLRPPGPAGLRPTGHDGVNNSENNGEGEGESKDMIESFTPVSGGEGRGEGPFEPRFRVADVAGVVN